MGISCFCFLDVYCHNWVSDECPKTFIQYMHICQFDRFVVVVFFYLVRPNISSMIPGIFLPLRPISTSPCLSSSVFPHPHHRLSAKLNLPNRLTHIHAANLQHTHTHKLTHQYYYKRVEHNLVLSCSLSHARAHAHTHTVCDEENNTMSSQGNVYTHSGHCSHSHTRIQRHRQRFQVKRM